MDPTQEAADVVKSHVKGAGLPTPELEKQIELENSGTPSYQPSNHDGDDAYGDGPIPTDEEIHTLRRVPASIPWLCFTVAFCELCERFAYYGTTAVRKFTLRFNCSLCGFATSS
jgi:POT family proton-dependent oligopeptide transporter